MSDQKYICSECGGKFKTLNSLQVHKSNFKPDVEGGVALCKLKKIQKTETQKRKHEAWENKQKIRSKLKATDPTQLCNAIEQQETTNELLQQLTTQVQQQSRELQRLFQQNELLCQQNVELKEIVVDIQNNPQLVIVCNRLYPLKTLRELDLGEARFEPVRQILNNELPQYANLASNPTAQVHCKAIKTLNMVHPMAVKDGEQVFYKCGDIMKKDINHETTRAFIEAIANSGYEYAKKARQDLTRNLESDISFKKQVLQNASIESIFMVNALL